MDYKNKTLLTVEQATIKVTQTLTKFVEQRMQGVYSQYAKIGEMEFKELFKLYMNMVNQKFDVALFMPGELGTECMTILYAPSLGCVVEIESVPAVDYKWRVRQINLKDLVN